MVMRFEPLKNSFTYLAVGLILAFAGTLQGCSNNEPSEPFTAERPAVPKKPSDNHDIRRMTVTELRDSIAEGNAVVLDVRARQQFKNHHIKGAVNIPEGEVAARASELPRDKLIVAYCS